MTTNIENVVDQEITGSYANYVERLEDVHIANDIEQFLLQGEEVLGSEIY